MDYLKKAKELAAAGNTTAMQYDADEQINCYLGSIACALIVIAERLSKQDAILSDPSTDVEDIFSHLPVELQEDILGRKPTQEELDREQEIARDVALPIEPQTRGSSKLFKT